MCFFHIFLSLLFFIVLILIFFCSPAEYDRSIDEAIQMEKSVRNYLLIFFSFHSFELPNVGISSKKGIIPA